MQSMMQPPIMRMPNRIPSFQKKRPRIFIIIGIILVVLIMIGGFWYYQQQNKDQQPSEQPKKDDAASAPADAQPAEQQPTDQLQDQDVQQDEPTNDATPADVTVTPLKDSKTFDVFIGQDKIGTITRAENSSVSKIVTRDTHAYIGFNLYGIGGIYYIGPDEVWKVDPKSKTMEKIDFSGTTLSGISLDEQKIAYVGDKKNELHVRNLITDKEKIFSVDGYDIIGDTLFSPNSDKIAVQLYKSTVQDKDPTAVYFYNFTTGSQTQIVEKETIVNLKQWNGNSEIEYSSRSTSMNDF